MIQGMSARILERINRCKTYKGNYTHKMFRNSVMVCSVMISKKEAFITVWTFKPVTVSEYISIDNVMKAYAEANKGKTIYFSHANLQFS